MPLLKNKIQPEVLKDKVAPAIRNAILSGELKPGERLAEGHLMQQLGVSRAPLRDAFWALEKQGYVKMIPYRGAFVVKLSRQEVQNIFDVRRLLEPWAVVQARQNAGPQDLKELQELFREMRRTAEKNDLLSNFRVDLTFHRKIWKLSGNPKLEEILNSIVPSLFTYLLIVYQSNPWRMREGIGAHEKILNVLRGDKEPAEVERIAQAELEGLEKMTLKSLKE